MTDPLPLYNTSIRFYFLQMLDTHFFCSFVTVLNVYFFNFSVEREEEASTKKFEKGH